MRLASWAPTYVGPLPSSVQQVDAVTVSAEPTGEFGEGSFRPGQNVAGRYIISSLLGRGGVGMVYKAMDTTLGEEIAIKVLQVQTHRDPRDVERFKREILTARRITHPNVIRIHDFGTVGSEAFISMQLLTGGTLAQKIENGVLPTREAVNIAIGICEGLEAAHQEGIVHRDIKPDNVLFDGNGRPKLVDFGLARLANATTRTVGFSGTPFYMSPEQAEGTEASATSDVYSLGVLLYEMFVGKLPFLADSLVRLVVLHTRELPPNPRAIRPDVPEEIEQIILQALEKDPKKRQGSAAEVAEQFKAWRSGLPVPRPPRDDDRTDIRPLPDTGTPSPAQRRAEAPTMIPSSLRGGTAPDRIAPERAAPVPPIPPSRRPEPAEGSGTHRVAYVAGSGLLAILLALGGFVLSGGFGRDPIAVATPTATNTSMATTPIVAPTAVAVVSVPVVAPTVVPTAVSKATPRPMATRPIVARTSAPAPTPTAQPTRVATAGGNGMLWVGTETGTWVNVSIDGDQLPGESPYFSVPVPAGKHTIRFYNKELKIDLKQTAVFAKGHVVQFKVVKGDDGAYAVHRLQ